MLRGSEDHTTLKEGLQPVLDEMNELVESRLVELQDAFYELDFSLQGRTIGIMSNNYYTK